MRRSRLKSCGRTRDSTRRSARHRCDRRTCPAHRGALNRQDARPRAPDAEPHRPRNRQAPIDRPMHLHRKGRARTPRPHRRRGAAGRLRRRPLRVHRRHDPRDLQRLHRAQPPPDAAREQLRGARRPDAEAVRVRALPGHRRRGAERTLPRPLGQQVVRDSGGLQVLRQGDRAADRAERPCGRGRPVPAGARARVRGVRARAARREPDRLRALAEDLPRVAHAARSCRRAPQARPPRPGGRVPGHELRPGAAAGAPRGDHRKPLHRRRRGPGPLPISRRDRPQHPQVPPHVPRLPAHSPHGQPPVPCADRRGIRPLHAELGLERAGRTDPPVSEIDRAGSRR